MEIKVLLLLMAVREAGIMRILISGRRDGYGGPRGSFRGGRRGGYSNDDAAEAGERTRRTCRGNWGTPEIARRFSIDACMSNQLK
uniref:Uncharacterized protein n=1 Tax=Kalanchoe fedtschenkoi TaxID=63787 RepID=A0A7N0U5G6_KALFE